MSLQTILSGSSSTKTPLALEQIVSLNLFTNSSSVQSVSTVKTWSDLSSQLESLNHWDDISRAHKIRLWQNKIVNCQLCNIRKWSTALGTPEIFTTLNNISWVAQGITSAHGPGRHTLKTTAVTRLHSNYCWCQIVIEAVLVCISASVHLALYYSLWTAAMTILVNTALFDRGLNHAAISCSAYKKSRPSKVYQLKFSSLQARKQSKEEFQKIFIIIIQLLGLTLMPVDI